MSIHQLAGSALRKPETILPNDILVANGSQDTDFIDGILSAYLTECGENMKREISTRSSRYQFFRARVPFSGR